MNSATSTLLTPGTLIRLAQQNDVPVSIETVGGQVYEGKVLKEDGYGVILGVGPDFADSHGIALVVREKIAAIRISSLERLTRQPIEAHAL